MAVIVGRYGTLIISGIRLPIAHWEITTICPYSLLYEFDQWFEWHRRIEFGVDNEDN